MTDFESSILPFRQEIDKIDTELLRLLNRRAELALRIGAVKHKMHCPVTDTGRENVVIGRLLSENVGPLTSDHITGLWEKIMSQSRELQANQCK